MQQKLPKDLKGLWTDVKDYLDVRFELIKLITLKKGAKIAADLVTNTIVLICLLMVFLASAVTLAFYFSELLNSYTRGFGCAAIFFTILPFILLWKKAAVEKFIGSMAVRRYFQKHNEEEE